MSTALTSMARCFAFICLFGFVSSLPHAVLAADYAMPPGSSPESAGQSEACTKEDLRRIKTFNVKARKKLRDYEKFVEEASKAPSTEEQRRLSREASRLMDFYLSEEFQEMAELYRQCDLVIPRPTSSQGYWVPDAQRVPAQ